MSIIVDKVSKLFRAYRLYNRVDNEGWVIGVVVSKLFRAYRLYNLYGRWSITESIITFQSSFELTGYITS